MANADESMTAMSDVRELEKVMVRVETKLDAALASQADHECRLRRVEFGTIAAIVISTVAVGTRIADIASAVGR
jgi:hypothetical protein